MYLPTGIDAWKKDRRQERMRKRVSVLKSQFPGSPSELHVYRSRPSSRHEPRPRQNLALVVWKGESCVHLEDSFCHRDCRSVSPSASRCLHLSRTRSTLLIPQRWNCAPNANLHRFDGRSIVHCCYFGGFYFFISKEFQDQVIQSKLWLL